MIQIGNAPCSWGVEFADDPRNPKWQQVLQECSAAGFKGIELGPVGYMPEQADVLKDALQSCELKLIGGVLFQPFHDPKHWPALQEAAKRNCEVLAANQAQQLVLIDSIAEVRAKTAGRPNEAQQMSPAEWAAYVQRIETITKMASEEYGLTVSMHAHAGGFCDFEPELERLLNEIDEKYLKICLDTAHSTYAGFDPLEFIKKYPSRLAYVHLKDIDPKIKQYSIQHQVGFYEACAEGLFCNLGAGEVDFLAVKNWLEANHFNGWCTVEQDCDPSGETSPKTDALKNHQYLSKLGF